MLQGHDVPDEIIVASDPPGNQYGGGNMQCADYLISLADDEAVTARSRDQQSRWQEAVGQLVQNASFLTE